MAGKTGEVTIRLAGNYDAAKFVQELDSVSKEYFFQAIDQLGKLGEEDMRRTIIKSDSKYSRSGLKALMGFNLPGRMRTGKMYQSAGSRPRGRGKLFQAEIGYIRGTYEKYFKFQEFGFYNIWKYFGRSENGKSYGPNTPSGGFIMRRRANPQEYRVPGIFALRNARQEVERQIIPVMNKVGAKIDRRMNRLSK